MARARQQKPVEVEAEDISQEIEEETAIEPEPATMSKAAAAKAALEAGIDSPKDAVEFALKKFGVEIKGADFSAVKSRLKGSADPAKRGRPSGVATRSSTPTVASSDLLVGLQALKPLIAQFGADQLKQMIDVLG